MQAAIRVNHHPRYSFAYDPGILSRQVDCARRNEVIDHRLTIVIAIPRFHVPVQHGRNGSLPSTRIAARWPARYLEREKKL